MAINTDDLEPRAKPAQGLLPADLSRHSIAELEALIVALGSEIERCRAAITAKRSTRDAAENFFKK